MTNRMELTQTYHNKTTFTNQPQTSFGEILATFVRKHAQAFQSLTRGGSPYGASMRPDYTRLAAPVEASPHQQIAQLQRQLQNLSQTVSQLRDQLDRQTSVQRDVPPEQIGLSRFRALKTGVCS